ncbi:MAG: chemotaxis protein [Alphaproteobacteria bacterium]|nr:MAG: chemotaxis protein [Alphaproteobacteria bacterium]
MTTPATTFTLRSMKSSRFGLIISILLVASMAIFITIGIQSQSMIIPLAGIVVTGLAAIMSWFYRTKLTSQLNVMEQALTCLAKGDEAVEIPETAGDNNLVEMFRSIRVIRDAIKENTLFRADTAGQIDAIGKAQAVIEFNMDGTIITANDHFLNALGYRLDEIQGQHHSMFVEPAFKESSEYRSFWDRLNRGEYEAREYKRIGKGGKTIWIQASYNPILDLNGKPFKVVKYATDITGQKQQNIINQNIKTATDSVRTNIMMVDTDHTVIYMNKTMQDMIKAKEAQLRTDLPALDFNNPVGAGIDAFHKDPSFLRKLLDSFGATGESHIEVGGIEFYLEISKIQDVDGKAVGAVIEWEDVTEKLVKAQADTRLAEENQRIKIALDNTSTNVMVADKDLNIVYMNDILRKMMHEAEPELRKALPNFDASKLIGTNIDVFHKNPAHQRGMMQNLTSTIESNIKVGGFDFNLVVNPVTGKDGERLGTVVEWKDTTKELAIEAEINGVVNAAAAGEFSQRISTSDKEGFMLNLANNINSICANTKAATDDLARVLAELAQGNLTEKIDADYEGTFELLKDSANETADKLTSIVTQVNGSAGEVASAAAELSTGSDDLSQRTEAQASALEETAASMEQLAVTVKQNADNAKEANLLANKSREMAVNGGEVATEAVDAMGVIEESSQKVSDIIGVIDDLAFQTNLLALNAAVEAARAGEAGKGFAVVAEEVRTLAQRSAQASNEIKSLITSSNAQVKSGVELVNNAGTALGEIMESIAKVAEIVAEIASASSEQAQGIDEVNVAIAEMDDMTQQNSSLVEESTAAARVLERQAAEMQRLMSFFRVAEGGGQMAASPVLVQQAQAARAAEPVKTPVLKKTAAGGDAEWSEF